MKRLNTIIFLCFAMLGIQAQDSLRVEQLLKKGLNAENPIIYYASEFRGCPYAAKTLEVNEVEELIVDAHRFDCTTFVETVTALSMTTKEGKTDYRSFCNNLRRLRYKDGEIDYRTRLHYFSQWIEEHKKHNRVEEVAIPQSLYPTRQTLQLHFMTTHVSLYPLLVWHPEYIGRIAELEKEISGTVVQYIPKSMLDSNTQLRKIVSDGDIIAIVTNKDGLDISHVGFALWQADGLHLFHASSVHKKVIVEPHTLYQYMATKKAQTGIRVIRLRR